MMSPYSIDCDWLFRFIIILFIWESNHSQLIRPVKTGLKLDPRGTMELKDSISLFEMRESRSVIKVDLNRPLRQQAIVIRNSKSVKLNIFCSIHIPPNSIKKTDVQSQLCYQTSTSQMAQCVDLKATKSNSSMFNMKVTIISIRNDTGYDITLDSAETGDNDISGYYYCRSSTTSAGVVLSNILEIRDLIYWGKNLIISQPQPVHEKYQYSLDSSQMPKSFACIDQLKSHIAKEIPNWIELEFKSIIKWTWCPVSKQGPNMMELEKTYVDDCLTNTQIRCDKPSYLCPLDEMSGWKELISFDGTITLMSGQKFNDYGNKLDGFALMCYFKSKDNYRALRYIANDYINTQFAKGLQWIDRINDRRSIEIISPLRQTIRIGILKKGFTLTAFYYCPSNCTYEWRRDGDNMYNSSEWSLTSYSLDYKKKINLRLEGEYFLRVRYGARQIEFMFNIIVASPPILVNTSFTTTLSSIYFMVDSNVYLTYRYKCRPTSLFIYINGLIYKPGVSDRTIFMNDLTKNSFYLKDLNFSVSWKNLPKHIVELTYNATKVSFSNMLMLAQDHSLIVEAINSYGISRTHLNINVLKFPTYINLPKSDNCSVTCSSRQPHLFHCEINDEYYTDRDVVVEKFWMINDMRLDSLPYYSAFFKEDSKGLHMSAINSNNTEHDVALKLLFKYAKLVCRIRLLYPDSLGLSENDLIFKKRIIFDSNSDPTFVSQSSIIIQLDWESPISTASYTWVVFLVIAILLIIMFLFLLVRLTLREQGSSYQIEKLEIAKGINRDEEIIENETIKPYVRSGKSVGCQIDFVPLVTVHYRLDKSRAPVLCSECHILQYGDVSGNGINSSTNKSFLPGYKQREALEIIDDENEIDNELEDPSKFNEEGSFIGVYASKDKLSQLPKN